MSRLHVCPRPRPPSSPCWRMSARLAPSSRPLPLLFVAFLSFFVFPWPSPLRVINVIIITVATPYRRRRRRRRRSLLRIVHARGAIPNEMGSARCRATPALNQSADETRTPASRCLPSTCPCRLPPLGLGGGGGGVYLESYTREARFLTRWDQHAVAQRRP